MRTSGQKWEKAKILSTSIEYEQPQPNTICWKNFVYFLFYAFMVKSLENPARFKESWKHEIANQ